MNEKEEKRGNGGVRVRQLKNNMNLKFAKFSRFRGSLANLLLNCHEKKRVKLDQIFLDEIVC
jgi:hypothetical protein